MRAHFAEYLAEFSAARPDGSGRPSARVAQFAAPSIDELRDTPFAGDGPDPLEEIGQ